jgi:hypothetical protein
VTRLGDFSPLGRLFTLGSFLKRTEVAKLFGLLFKRSLILGHILGYFFTNSSGHPGMFSLPVLKKSRSSYFRKLLKIRSDKVPLEQKRCRRRCEVSGKCIFQSVNR